MSLKHARWELQLTTCGCLQAQAPSVAPAAAQASRPATVVGPCPMPVLSFWNMPQSCQMGAAGLAQ